jgi:membrane-bound lytic murein transglycosylase MltF
MRNSFKEWYPKIIAEAKEDAQLADLMDNIKRGKIDPLVRSAFSVALLHGCVNYAKFLLQVENNIS